eukprot:1183193-Amphidinium_carterae.1
MPGYRSSPVSVQVEVSTNVGRELTTVVRQLTQLGFGSSIVELQEPGPIVVAPITMQKVGVKFARNTTALWSTATPALVASALQQHIVPEAFADIICRQDANSATVMVVTSEVRKLLKASGQGQ